MFTPFVGKLRTFLSYPVGGCISAFAESEEYFSVIFQQVGLTEIVGGEFRIFIVSRIFFSNGLLT